MKIPRDAGLDLLKAISIIFVLLWHLQPFKFFQESGIISNIFNYLLDIFNIQVSLTAVPIFIVVSLYLFFATSNNHNDLKKRLARILQVFIFWSAIQFMFSYFAIGKIPQPSVKMIMGVAPELPFVGDSVLYFLFNLFFVTAIAFLFKQAKAKLQRILSIITIVFYLINFEIISSPGINVFIPYWNLENFIIYIPIAFYLAKYKEKILKFKKYYLLAYIVFSIQDIYLRYSNYGTSIYARNSIVFGALTIFCFVYPLEIKNSKYVQLLSKYALGIYAIHKYWQSLFIILISHSNNLTNLTLNLNWLWFCVAVITVIFTFGSVYLLSWTKLRRFVM